ncbi:MAG: bifunctional riboflavin kinase/FAD synthetase [Ignavibacteriales bacterium]
MKVINGVENYTDRSKPLVLALGNFDGVHIGHQFLVREANEEAKRIDGISAMLVFDPHPLKVLVPSRAPKLLTTLKQKTRILDELGLDLLIVTPFTRDIAAWSPESFVHKILVKTLGVKAVFVGYNYSFGSKAAGDAEMMKALGQKNNIDVHIINPIMMEGQVVSSTLVRKCLENGDIDAVRRFTGRLPLMEGKVVEGEKRGKTIGIPTANLAIDKELVIPGNGVYAVKACVKGQTIEGVVNIGRKPTFHPDFPVSIEAHFFDFDQDIYGETISIALVSRLREEQKFNGVQELIDQIDIDAKQARRILEDCSTDFDNILKSF